MSTQQAPEPNVASGQVKVVELPGDPITTLTDPKTRDLEPGRDRVRAALAVGLLLVLAAIVVLGFVLVLATPESSSPDDRTLDSRITFVLSLLGPVAGLFGAATGFYFGASRDRQ